MANIHPDIKPNGLTQKWLVNALYMICASLQGLCQKLDDDGSVPLGGGAGAGSETYEANCITAIFNLSIEDTRGNRFSVAAGASSSIEEHHIISPTGISDAALLAAMYQITNSFETLCEQLDTDTLNLSTYEANCYTAKFLHIVENVKGNQLGNGTAYYFRPGGVVPQDKLVDWLYNTVDALETLTEQLDTDTTPADDDYEATWFTATCLINVENSQGNVVGNASTSFG